MLDARYTPADAKAAERAAHKMLHAAVSPDFLAALVALWKIDASHGDDAGTVLDVLAEMNLLGEKWEAKGVSLAAELIDAAQDERTCREASA